MPLPLKTRILNAWKLLAPWPGGRWLFSRLTGWMVPYSGSIGARVESLSPGHCVVTLRDRRAVRNHLASVHAVALANLGELTSGLAMLTAVGPTIRGIVVSLTIDFHKKARGRLRATSHVAPPAIDGPTNTAVTAVIADHTGEAVATVTVTWRLTPIVLE